MDRELLFLVKTIRSTGVCSVVLRPIRVRVHFVLCATRASRRVNLPMHQFVQGCLASIIKNLSPKNKTSLIAQAKGVPTILSPDRGGRSPVGKRSPSGSQRLPAKGLVTVTVAVWHGV